MISPTILKELMMEASSEITAIAKCGVVATDDEFVELLKDHKTGMLLVGVLPAYGGYGEEDEAGLISFMQFFILEKSDYKSFKYNDEYIAVFERTLAATNLFVSGLFMVTGQTCQDDVLQYDFQIRPISRKAQCNGYEIQIDSKAFTDNF